MLGFIFGGSAPTTKQRPAAHPFPSSSSRAYPPTNSDTPYGGAATEGGYDDVALGGGGGGGSGGGDLGESGMAPPRNSLSAPPASSDGAFVGSSASASSAPTSSYPPPNPSRQDALRTRGGYSAESSYPPLPSFSRPSASSSGGPANAARYPPPHATLARLRALLNEQSPSLLDTLSPGLASSPADPALSSLRAALAPYELPRAVVDSYLAHDGQDPSLSSSGGGAAGGARIGGLGLVYGLWWLPLDQVEQEWRFWRKLEDAGGLQGGGIGGDAFAARVGGAAARKGGRAHPYVPDEEEGKGQGVADGDDGNKGSDVPGMGSFPDGWVRKRYSHPGWLPLLTDRCGNYIGVDLDPPPPSSASSPSSSASFPAAPGAPAAKARTYGQPGQVIAFGREIDDKVVLFPGDGPGGWARFLAAFVDDVERGEFARLGERPGAGDGAVDERGWDDEEGGGGRGARRGRRDSGSGGSSGEEEDWRGADDDGLGDRGYFESDVYGEEVVGSGPGARSAQTWVLRSEYRRMAAKLDLPGGVIGLLCERSRRKWRSLGVGSSVPQPRHMLPMVVPGSSGSGRPLSVMVPPSTATGIEVVQEDDEEPQSATTERPSPLAPPVPVVEDAHPLASPAASSVSLVLSPPSPVKARTGSAQPQLHSRSSHESSHSHASSAASGGDNYHLRDPPRSPRRSQPQPSRQPRRPPPPPAALDLPTFSDLDFSDAVVDSGLSPGAGGAPVVVPKASWLLSSASEGRDALAGAGAAAFSRLSISSSTNGHGGSNVGGGGGGGGGGGARSPTLLPVALSRAESDERALQLSERASNSSRTALVAPEEGGAPSPTSEGAAESPVERVEVVSHRA